VRNLLFVAVASVTMAVAVPAVAQVYIGGGPTPGGVDAAPVGPNYRSYDQWRGDEADVGDCHVVRERTIRPNGRVTVRSYRECD
jgi:hypothetical protein